MCHRPSKILKHKGKRKTKKGVTLSLSLTVLELRAQRATSAAACFQQPKEKQAAAQQCNGSKQLNPRSQSAKAPCSAIIQDTLQDLSQCPSTGGCLQILRVLSRTKKLRLSSGLERQAVLGITGCLSVAVASVIGSSQKRTDLSRHHAGSFSVSCGVSLSWHKSQPSL